MRKEPTATFPMSLLGQLLIQSYPVDIASVSVFEDLCACCVKIPRCVFQYDRRCLAHRSVVLGQSPEFSFRSGDSGAAIIQQACHWYELEIEAWDVSGPRSQATAPPGPAGVTAPFWGGSRQTCIAGSRYLDFASYLMTSDGLQQQLAALRSPIEKTAGPRELQAWSLIEQSFFKACTDSGEHS